jgi:pimeloyl-ACP methyl ester carboxylesterase
MPRGGSPAVPEGAMRWFARTAAPLALAAVLACAGPSEAPAPPPTSSGHRDARVDSFDGVPIAYSIDGSAGGAVLFIHGWSCDRGYWEAQVADLTRDYRVVTVDLAGHGDSGAGRSRWTVEAFGRDVEAVVDDLALDSVILVGHSMGGPVALEAARRLHGRVVGVIGIDTLHDVELRYPDEEWDRILSGLERDFVPVCDAFVRGMFLAGADPELVREVASDMCSAPPEVAIGALAGLRDHDAAATLAAAGVPLRCINATTEPTNVEANRRHARDFDVITIEGTGHFPMLERPDELNRLLRQAIEELTASPGVEAR